jgi:voltage-gated potassium channel
LFCITEGALTRDPLDQKLNKIRISIAILVGLIIVSTVVFWAIGGSHTIFDALWMTLQVVTTVGDTGFERSAPEKLWSVVLMVVGVVSVFYLGINVFAFVLDGELRQLLGRRKLQSRIKKMKGHIIVCGFGRMGRSLCEALEAKKQPFVAIDLDSDTLSLAADRGYMHLIGDAMSEDLLREAQIETARGLASCLSQDADNVFVTLTASDIAPNLPIVSKANYSSGADRIRRAGATHVLSPSGLAANRAMTKLMLPAVDELIEIVVHGPDLEISKVSVDRLPKVSDKPLRELEIPNRTSLLVVAVIHQDGSRSCNPTPDARLKPHDELIVIGPHGGVDKLIELFGEDKEVSAG